MRVFFDNVYLRQERTIERQQNTLVYASPSPPFGQPHHLVQPEHKEQACIVLVKLPDHRLGGLDDRLHSGLIGNYRKEGAVAVFFTPKQVA
jgi:hypothetical protein